MVTLYDNHSHLNESSAFVKYGDGNWEGEKKKTPMLGHDAIDALLLGRASNSNGSFTCQDHRLPCITSTFVQRQSQLLQVDIKQSLIFQSTNK